MITDSFEHLLRYQSIHPSFTKAFAFLLGNPLKQLQPGKYMIDNDNIFAIVNEYHTKTIENYRWEVHRKYIDIQLIIDGTEKIGLGLPESMQEVEAYDEIKDIAFYNGEGSYVTLPKNSFMILFPGEYHMPGVINEQAEYIKKIVVKVNMHK